MTGHERTFKSADEAMRALALAEGYKGSAGGWIYRPSIADLPIKPGHSAAGGAVPNEWRGTHVCQSWVTFFSRKNYYTRIGVTDDGRFYVKDAAKLLEENKSKSSAAYSQYLVALSNGDEAEATRLRARHEGWKVRVFAAYELANGGTVKLPKAERVLA